MNSIGNSEYLLTPGPLTTSLSVKSAVLRDWGSRDQAFIDISENIRRRLVELVDGVRSHTCVPMQGSGTFAVEAVLGTLIPKEGRVLVLVNGAYGKRIVQILNRIGRSYSIQETPEDTPCDPKQLDVALGASSDITHVAVVHCETTSGILNPIEEIAAVVNAHGRRLLIDSMSAFGAIPVRLADCPFDALMASSNKCLEGLPGVSLAIIREESLREAEGNCHSLSLDLYEQWRGLVKNGQWRFTPPTHVLAAFEQALIEHEKEGGVEGRGGRYLENCKILSKGMSELGFQSFLPAHLQAPIILTFYSPADNNFDFDTFYRMLGDEGYLIYPGKLTQISSFRIGCIGQVGPEQMHGVLRVIRSTLEKMAVTNCSPSLEQFVKSEVG